MSDSYLQNLNAAQRNSVIFDHKKALQIIAGPGTGKTKVLTARFAYLVLKKGISAEDIIMTTFTRKAAEEMKERLIPVLVANGISVHMLKIGTFHSICWRLLREKGYLIGKPKMERATTEKIKAILEEVITEMPDQIRDYASTKSYKNEISLCRMKNNQWQVHPDMISKRIAELKAEAVTPEKYAQREIYDEALLHFYEQYQAKLLKDNLIDFDDVMLYSFELLSKHRVWKNIKHVLVDEFQDTNLLQIHLIFQFARGSHHSCEGVTVVGDPDQGIYGFRSALSHNFQTMIELCPIEYHQIVLRENYRSAQAILDISETVIKQQKNGRDNREPLRAQFATDNRPVYMSFPSDDIEAYSIAKEIIYLKSLPGVFNYKDFSILVRLKRSFRTIEDALIAHKIPYKIQKGNTFWELKECKTIIRYMSMICNDDDWNALKRTINYPVRGVGDTTLGKIALALEKECQNNKDQTVFGYLQKIANGIVDLHLGSKNLSGIKDYVSTIETLRGLFSDIYSDSSKDTIADAFDKLYLLSGMKNHYKPEKKSNTTGSDESDKESHRHFNVINVKNYFSTFKIPIGENEKIAPIVDLIEFCREFISFTDLYTFREENEDDIKDENTAKDAVTLSTIHASKGLEWPVVFVPQCIEGLLPSYYKDSSDLPLPDQDSEDENPTSMNELESGINSQEEFTDGKNTNSPSKKKAKLCFSEERRMFFVALTRAKFLLYITTVEKEGTSFRSRFLKNEVIQLCDDNLKCFSSVEQLFKLYYIMKLQIPNQDRISYEQLIIDYQNYCLSNRQFIYWKNEKHSHTNLPNVSENTNGIDTKIFDVASISSALPRVNRNLHLQNAAGVKPAEAIVKSELGSPSDDLIRSAASARISPQKMPALTREETLELEMLLSDSELQSDNQVKRERDYTAAEILHDKTDSIVDNRPILTSANFLAKAIKLEVSRGATEIDSTTESRFFVKQEALPLITSTKSTKEKKRTQTKRISKKIKLEPKSGNDILKRLERAKQKKEEWDGEIIDLLSSQ